MRVYHFVSADYGLQNIERRRLKVATIDDVNDPFELFAHSQTNRQFRRIWSNARFALAKDNGILCFSENWANPVQWSHYADRHKGICLGFEVPKSNLVQVQYVEERLRPDIANLRIGSSATSDVANSALNTKFSHWSYEKEWRVWVKLDHSTRQNGLYFCDFSNKLALKEVIVGHNSRITRQQLKAALGELDPVVTKHKARLAFQTFTVTRQRRDSAWS